MPKSVIDEYIAQFPPDVRKRLRAVRDAIRERAPLATEKISYRMPTFFLNGNLVHFAAFQAHVGLFPTPSGVAAFERELAPYVHAKGSIRFPFDRPLPLDLIRRIVDFRVAEMSRKKAPRARKPAKPAAGATAGSRRPPSRAAAPRSARSRPR